jgi:hypothetical protein
MLDDGITPVAFPTQDECWWSVADVMNRTQVSSNERLTTLPASGSVPARGYVENP